MNFLKKKTSQISLCLLIVMTLFSTLMSVRAASVQDKLNIDNVIFSKKENNSSWTDIVDPSQNDYEIKVGDTIRLTIKWSMDDVINKVNPGDHFVIELPETYFHYQSSGIIDLANADDPNHPLGSYQIIGTDEAVANNTKPRIIVTINATGASKSRIENGYLYVEGLANAVSDGSIDFSVGGENFPGFPIDPRPEVGEFPGHLITEIDKMGYQLNSNIIEWAIRLNYDQFYNAFMGESVEIRNNVILYDKIDPEMTFVDFRIDVPIYLANEAGGLSGNVYSNPSIDNETQFKEIEQESLTLDEFIAKVEAETVPAYGIYRASDGTSLIINFGQLPSDTLEIAGVTLDSLKADLDWSVDQLHTLTPEIAEKTYEAYQNVFDESSTGIIGVVVNIQVEVENSTKSYHNEATMKWNDTTSKTDEYMVDFVEHGGGATGGDPQSVTIKKLGFGSNEELQGVSFELLKWDDATSLFVHYNLYGGQDNPQVTNPNGEIVFKSLESGTYKVVEVSGLAGYSDKITFENDKDEFTIDGSETGTINIVAYNYELTEISGVKHWDDNGDSLGYRPENIELTLQDQNGHVIDTSSTSGVSLVWDKNTDIDHWSYTFSNLDKYNESGDLIEYQVTEKKVSQYDVSYGNNYEITNTFAPELKSISGTKTWNDQGNAAGFRPEAIELILKDQNGNTYDAVPVWTNTDQDVWTYEYKDLMKYDKAGLEINYVVSEIAVAHYTSSYDTTGLHITNTFVPEVPVTPENPDKPVLPNTGIASPLGIAMLIGLTGIVFVAAAKKIKKEDC